ncbi:MULTISPECIES: hypothetical protein [unclassified Nocardioides]|uniref:hypothetical protein n=1 Tax=unclassified Nocardioides TaxID=2615069 RepID=UPI0009EFCA70|nr:MULTISPECIES: hypothetical protein [unclassified Nocardioides]GAW50877.1 uncharacterized protein PD653B2_3213 [Nocardioides sp. PD653-B2]GAW54035.1 uncharacterized protein PD653_1442 [Nocardioides sp. PD653]
MRTISNPKKTLAALATVALLAGPLAACGSSDSEGSSSSSSAAAPKPVAAIDALQGETTAIALDKGFTDALTALKLTPGVVGTAKLEDGSLIFPITGGNVTVFKPGEVSPYVIGQVQHEGSGLSLTAGGTTVELTNFNVDPGVSRVYGDVSVNGKVAVTNAFLFQLDGRTLQPLQTEGSNAILEGTKVEISADAAPLLNQTFKTDAVKPGLLVGIAKITVNTTSK